MIGSYTVVHMESIVEHGGLTRMATQARTAHTHTATQTQTQMHNDGFDVAIMKLLPYFGSLSKRN